MSSETGYETLHIDDVPLVAFDEPEVPDWRPLRHRLGVGAFGVNAWVAKATGEQVIEPHDEKPGDGEPAGHEELYVVLRGSADFTVDGDSFEVHAGSVVFVRDPSLKREAVAREPGTTVLVVGAPPGEAFTPSEWEARWLAKKGVT
jgi:hypothetical protein